MKLKLLFALIFVSLILHFQNCSDVKLQRQEVVIQSVIDPQIQFCTEPNERIDSHLKFIFVMDRSGSNQSRDALVPGGQGTDPLGLRRFNAILNFVQSYPQNPNVHYTMVSFAQDVANANQPWTSRNNGWSINNSEGSQPFTSNNADFVAFIQDQQTNTANIDTDATNYISALQAARTIISTDINNAKTAHQADPSQPIVASNYVLFFVSDGEPWIVDYQLNQLVLQGRDSIIYEVGEIMNLRETDPKYVENIEVNTAFYFIDSTQPPDLTGYSYTQGAVDLLQAMSNRGLGEALTFGTNDTISFSNIAVPSRVARYEMRSLWIQNMNTVWETVTTPTGSLIGQLSRDSDGDNLSDDLEAALGSDPLLYDTDGDDVGDGVFYFINRRPCRQANCAPAGIPGGCMAAWNLSGNNTAFNINFRDQDGDFLNACEEELLRYRDTSFDINDDFAPDHFAWAKGAPVVQVTNLGTLDADQDNVMAITELLYNWPLLIDNRMVPGLEQLLRVGESSPGQNGSTCYSYRIENLATFSPQDRVRVYVMESTNAFRDTRVLKAAEKSLVDGRAMFGPVDFQTFRLYLE